MDWADAGIYPPAFESAALASQMSFPDFSTMVLSFLPRYPDEETQLHSIGYGLTTAALSEYGNDHWKLDEGRLLFKNRAICR
ncbi:kinase-like protein [Aspergillus udagawae]|uniref:Kinase-like protein n=1 Tax=Aspergillus udagawae TaxID=91492 RepID=A0A8H3NKZ0_9EURO|nr:kinase-like protein [Aspergillus udagawae]